MEDQLAAAKEEQSRLESEKEEIKRLATEAEEQSKERLAEITAANEERLAEIEAEKVKLDEELGEMQRQVEEKDELKEATAGTGENRRKRISSRPLKPKSSASANATC